MRNSLRHCWILDSGGAGRGAWQGGIIHEFMRWTRDHGCYPTISMGASAGGYAAADVATGTEATVLKGWTHWGLEEIHPPGLVPLELRSFWGLGKFRLHLIESIRYVMAETELAGVFDPHQDKKLLVFTTRVRRVDHQPFRASDAMRYFWKSVTRKMPRSFKYLPENYVEDPVVFATNLPHELCSENVRPLTRQNYHAVIEASCLVPLAMGSPMEPCRLLGSSEPAVTPGWRGDPNAVFLDGGFAMKMPIRIFRKDPRFQPLARWAAADKTLIFCCDPTARLWETSSRLRCLNMDSAVAEALEDKRMMIICPDHKIEAGFLCHDNTKIMKTFRRGQEQAERLLGTEAVQRFFGI